jgi:uridine kinase
MGVYEEARFDREIMPVADLRVLIAEGTYCTLLEYADCRVFVARDFHQTQEDRRSRGRDLEDEFTNSILQREHEFIREHKPRADFIVHEDGSVDVQQPARVG